MPTAEVTHPRLLSNLPLSSFERCRPPDIPPRLKGPNCESVDRKNGLARNQRTVRCIPRAYKNAISSFPPLTFDYPSDRSTHPFLLHDSYLPSNVCVFITVASGGQVDAREGRVLLFPSSSCLDRISTPGKNPDLELGSLFSMGERGYFHRITRVLLRDYLRSMG